MTHPIRILIVEDSESRCRIVATRVKAGRLRAQSERVETAGELDAALSRQALGPDCL